MHKMAMEMGKWALEHMKSIGYDNITDQGWDNLKDCMEVVKSAICADKDYRIVEAMDEAEQEDKFMGRMGYDRYRYANGRFAPKGRGKRMGYMPYLHMMSDDMEDYGPYDDMPYPMTGYRMGYTDGRSGDSGNMGNRGGNSNSGNSGNSNSYGYGDGDGNSRYGYEGMRQPSRYGESYDRYSDRRRHYHETKDAESKKQMDDSMKEYMSDISENLREMWKDADPTLRQTMKADLTKMVQQLQ